MTAKIVNFKEIGMTMVINRLTEYTVKHHSGLANVPHLCVKVKHPNGFAWLGLSIVAISSTEQWSRRLEFDIQERLVKALGQVIDLESLDSDIGLLMRSIQDITTGRRRPVMFGAQSNEFIQIGSTNNVQIELYRKEVKPESLSYGGYFLEVGYGVNQYPVLMYHHGVILNNYLTKLEALELLRNELLKHFPEHFSDQSLLTIQFDEIIEIPRNRNKWARVK